MTIRHKTTPPRPPGGQEHIAPRAPGVPRAQRQRWIASTTLAILASLLLCPSLAYPLARDQGLFAYVGTIILKGGWPYRDVWDLKPPGIYFTYAAILGCCGHSMAAVRAADLLTAVATVLLVYASLGRFLKREAAWLGALLYAALYLRLGFWGMAQAESYANFWTAAALYAWVRSSGRADTEREALAAGVATAAALLLKVTALPSVGAAVGVVSLLRLRREGWRPEARRGAAFTAGLLLLLAPVAAVLARSGAGAAYLEIQRGFVAGYVALPEGGAAAAGWRYFWSLYSVPIVLAAAGILVTPAAARLLLSAWLAAALASVMMQRKYFGYHWTPVLQPLAALSGVALARGLAEGRRLCLSIAGRARVSLFAPFEPGSGWVTGLLGAAMIAGWSVARPANGYAPAARLLAGTLPGARYWARFGRPNHGDFSFLADVWAARYIRDHTRRRDPIYIWGFEPLTLFLAHRYAPTRFVFAVPLVSPWTPAAWRAEFMREIQAHPPVLFGVMRHDAIPHASGRSDDSAAQIQQFAALRAFLRRNYRYETTIEDLTLFRRRARSDGQASEDPEVAASIQRQPAKRCGGVIYSPQPSHFEHRRRRGA